MKKLAYVLALTSAFASFDAMAWGREFAPASPLLDAWLERIMASPANAAAAAKDGKTYRVVANNFLAEGGDNFPEFSKGGKRVETGLLDLDAFTDYLKKNEGQGAALAPAPARILKLN